MKITKKLWQKMCKARQIANSLRDIGTEIDKEMSALGYDVDELRNSDEAGYVDMIDYGTGTFNIENAEQFHKH